MFNLQELKRREAKIASVYSRGEPASAVVSFAPFFFNLLYPYKESFLDFEKMERECRNIIDIMFRAKSDNPPFIHTFCSIGMVAEAFGCAIEMPDDQFPWTHQAISDINHVYSLKPKEVLSLSYYGQQRKWVDYAQRKIGADLAFWSLDIQSPFSVAAQIAGMEELLRACYDDPAAVHCLLRMVTDVTIELHDDHIRQMEHPGYPGRNFPTISDNIGLCMSDDTPLIMLSGDMYREFALPYANMVSEHFGGVHLHSCGSYMRNMDAALEIKGIRSVQFHAGPGEFALPEEPCENAFTRAMESVAMHIDTNQISRADQWADHTLSFYEEYLVPRLKCNTPKWLMLEAPAPDGNIDEYPRYSALTSHYLSELG